MADVTIVLKGTTDEPSATGALVLEAAEDAGLVVQEARVVDLTQEANPQTFDLLADRAATNAAPEEEVVEP